MPGLPSSLAALLSLFRPAFIAPTFETFCSLCVGFIARVGEQTVTGCLQAARLAEVWHHSRAHDFFTRRRWSPDVLGLLVLELLVTRFVGARTPLRLALDDSLFGRSGRKVFGAHFHYDDAQAPAGAGRALRFANSWAVCVRRVCLARQLLIYSHATSVRRTGRAF